MSEKGRQDLGVFELDFSGTIFTGAGNFIFDSCKNLNVRGLNAPTQNIILRGVWYSNFLLCRSKELIFADIEGGSYTSCYWDDFHTCVFQTIRRGSTNAPVNAITFYGISLRGNTGQGFTETADYNIVLEEGGTGANCQNWVFYGGDISYPVVDILDLQTSQEIELIFNGVYFDSKVPNIINLLPEQCIKTVSCHAAGKLLDTTDLVSALKADQDFIQKEASFGWNANSPLNLIPNGNLDQSLTNYGSNYFGPIGQFSGTITESTSSEGRKLNLLMGNGTQTETICRFRSVESNTEGKHTATLILKNNAAGIRRLNFGFNGQFFDCNIGQEWTVVTLSPQAVLSPGSDILMRSQDGLGYDIDVKYMGVHLGTNPPIICPPHPRAFAQDSIKVNEVVMGDRFMTLRSKIISGTGNPEGIETATPGSLYLNSTGDTGTSLYVKESGTGNTGWVAK
jgi:hypothetical protein